MKIQQLFKKDLARPINGVVKADQTDNDVVWNELDEYVLTRELDRHLRGFLDAYAESLSSKTNNMGVWVSGFFGSGKSHFIKILSYLLQNKAATDPQSGAAKNAVDFFKSKIDDKLLLSDINKATSKPTDVILFNIDAKADSKWGRDAVLQVFTRVFNEHQGFSADHPHIAHMERYLKQKGKLDVFEKAFAQKAGGEWKEERDAWQFHEDALRAGLAAALDKSDEDTKTWFDKSEKDFVLTVEKFAQWVQDYLDEKGPDHRILFFADEVGQFIGNDTHLMLNLQTIAENLGTACSGRAWVVVTSQEDIDAVLGEFRAVKEQDFSKIQGRFKTKLSLSSSNTDEVIGARLLDKTDDAAAALHKVFAEKGDVLRNDVSFTGTKVKFANYADEKVFAAAYPFAPYHFELLQKIFESIRRAGATGVHLAQGERSMLDAFQTAALAIKDDSIGALVPLHRFYPAIESFLDTTVKRTIDQAADNATIKGHPLAIPLLRTLFLIRYVDILPGNVDNLVTLCLSEIDQDKLALRKQIEEALDLLESQNLVSRNGDLYAFLTSEEQDVGREIKKTEVTPSEENRKIAELVFRDVLKDQTKHKYKETKTDYAFSRFCDGHLFGSKKEEDVVISVITPFIDSYASFNGPQCINQSTEHNGQLLIKLPERPTLLREVRQYLQTDKYANQKEHADNPETLKRILRDRRDENRERDARLRQLVEEMLLEADVYATGQSLDLNAKSVQALLSDGFDYLIKNTFNKMSLLSHPSKDASGAQAETQAVLNANDVQQAELGLGQDAPNAKAVQDVLQYIQLTTAKNHQIVLSDLVDRYEARPYGWPTYDIVLIVARLFVAGEVTLKMDSAALSPDEAKEPLSKRSMWKKVTLRKRATTPTALIKQARELGKDLFEKMSIDGEKEVFDFFVEHLGGWRDAFLGIQGLVAGGHYPGGDVVSSGLQRIEKLLHYHEPAEFFTQLLNEKNDWLDLGDDRRDVHSFFDNQRKIWDDLRAAVDSTYKANLHALLHREEAKKALDQIQSILTNANPYGLLHQASELLQTLATENQAAVDAMRPPCVAQIEGAIGHVKAAIDEAEKKRGASMPADMKNQALHPLQELFKTAKASTQIPTITDARDRSGDVMDDAIAEIEKWAEPDVPDPKKPVKAFAASAYVKSGPYLESAEDVEKFVAGVKEELLKLVATHRVKVR